MWVKARNEVMGIANGGRQSHHDLFTSNNFIIYISKSEKSYEMLNSIILQYDSLAQHYVLFASLS